MLRRNVQPDTRLNWTAIAELARLGAVADPPALATCDLPCHTSDPKARLWGLLDTWATMNEAEWTQEAVDGLKDSILDVFRDFPEAESWFREWRAAHPGAKLA